jgi:ElaB/YqjD/DUF883 family membrane-anchored ribosome-binding protein
MSEDPQVQAARVQADEAQGQLIRRLHELQQRIAPKTLARDAWEGAKSKGADLAEDAVDAVRSRPVAATGIAAAVALFLAREPLMDLAGKLVNGKSKKAKARQSRKRDMEKA